MDQLNHVLGRYIATGYHEPKKYPKEPLLSQENKVQDITQNFQQLAKQRYGNK